MRAVDMNTLHKDTKKDGHPSLHDNRNLKLMQLHFHESGYVFDYQPASYMAVPISVYFPIGVAESLSSMSEDYVNGFCYTTTNISILHIKMALRREKEDVLPGHFGVPLGRPRIEEEFIKGGSCGFYGYKDVSVEILKLVIRLIQNDMLENKKWSFKGFYTYREQDTLKKAYSRLYSLPLKSKENTPSTP